MCGLYGNQTLLFCVYSTFPLNNLHGNSLRNHLRFPLFQLKWEVQQRWNNKNPQDRLMSESKSEKLIILKRFGLSFCGILSIINGMPSKRSIWLCTGMWETLKWFTFISQNQWLGKVNMSFVWGKWCAHSFSSASRYFYYYFVSEHIQFRLELEFFSPYHLLHYSKRAAT